MQILHHAVHSSLLFLLGALLWLEDSKVFDVGMGGWGSVEGYLLLWLNRPSLTSEP